MENVKFKMLTQLINSEQKKVTVANTSFTCSSKMSFNIGPFCQKFKARKIVFQPAGIWIVAEWKKYLHVIFRLRIKCYYIFLDEFGIKSTLLLLNRFSIWCTITLSFEYATCVSFYFVNFPFKCRSFKYC